MTEKQKQISIIGGTSFLIILALVLLFFTMVNPHIQAANQAGQQLEEEEEHQVRLEQQLQEKAAENAEQPESTTDQQRRLPVVRLTDQFILDLSMAEELADIRIMDLQMSYDHPVYQYETVEVTPSEDIPDSGTTVNEVREEDEDEPNDPDEMNEEDMNEQDVSETDEEIELEETEAASDLEERQAESDEERTRGALQQEQMEGLSKQTATIELKVNNFSSLGRFLIELDSLQRFVNIESILFLGEEEDRIFDGQTDIFYEVQVSSFYYPELEHLEFEAPVVDYPDDGENTSPFLN
ncbi:hypothetical protein [Alkalicoccus daliensis]|uniref:Type IV pilus assembly protein PilO n=1 Tax=Alkalicoccus daliensis TaxID=745820 RepID=A0A1H0CMI8_9BACI|nr:hypothetical protein [Alkalicoccus daliensis]SDN59043.1 hypothetical protein SAMN04488053_102158 [Alkalicoccus daliensis]